MKVFKRFWPDDAKRYESFVANLLEHLAANDLVIKPSIQRGAILQGRSGQRYEIDVSYKFRVAGADYLTLVECKCWNRTVGINVATSFKAIVDDIGAHKGIIVTTVGFQEGAVRFGLSAGIGLFKVSPHRKSSLHNVAHIEGPGPFIAAYLCETAHSYASGPLREFQGLITTTTTREEFLSQRLGPGTGEIFQVLENGTLRDLPASEQKTAILQSLRQIHDQMDRKAWQRLFEEYYAIEVCCLRLWLYDVWGGFELTAWQIENALKEADGHSDTQTA